MLWLAAERDALTTGRCLQWWEEGGEHGGLWAWEQALLHFGTPLHRRTELHLERLDSAKMARDLEIRGGIHDHINYSHCNVIWE